MSSTSFTPPGASPKLVSALFPAILRSAALAACTMGGLLSFQESAAAARCPLGEIYRPSLGLCQSKEKAIAAGVYRGSAVKIEPRAQERNVELALLVTPKPRPQALAQIEKRAPREARGQDEAMAFAGSAKPSTANDSDIPQVQPVAVRRLPANGHAEAAPIQPKNVSAIPIVLRRETSPFGSLVALEPMP